jgi:hypothetical protein
MIALTNIANLLQKQKKYAEAKELYKRAYDVKILLLGEDHVDTQSVKEKLDTVERRLERRNSRDNKEGCTVQ